MLNKKIYKITKILIKPLLKFFFPYKILGAENLKKVSGKCIICPNHISIIDPIFLFAFCDFEINFMAKSELFRNPFLRWIFNRIGAFAVERGKGDQDSMNHAENVLKNNEILGIFIEGKCSRNGDFDRPKSGVAVLANKTNSPILPVCITGSAKNNFVRIFRKTTISFGEIISPEELGMPLISRIEIKNASKLIMERIKSMR